MVERRASPQTLSRLENDLKRLKKELGSVGLFADGVKTSFWKAIQEKFEPRLESIEMELDQFSRLSDRQIQALLQERLDLRGFLGVKDYVKARSVIALRISEKERQIKEYRERIDGS